SCGNKEQSDSLTAENLVSGLSTMKRLWKEWSSVLLCLYEAGKLQKMNLFDIFCEALDPNDKPVAAEKGVIHQVVRRIKDLSVSQLYILLQNWRKHTEEIPKICDVVDHLLSLLDSVSDVKSSKQDGSGTGTPKMSTSRSNLNM